MKNRRTIDFPASDFPASRVRSSYKARRSVGKKTLRLANDVGRSKCFVDSARSPSVHEPDLEGSLSRLGEVTARVAHDFANLTLVMREQIALAQEDLPEGHPAKQPLIAASLAAQQAADLTDALRQWARGAGDVRSPVNLTDELPSWCAFVKSIIPTSVIFDGDFPPLPPMWIDGNAVALKRALANLVHNACEAMPRGGRLALCAALAGEPVGSELLLRLYDTGCGMSPDVLENVFKPLFSTKHGSSGRGLGMAIVREVADFHGGRVEIDSTPGCGTCVTLRFPVRATKDESSGASASGRRVSIIAVDRMLAKRVRAALEPAGFRVTCAPWGQGENVVRTLLRDPPQAFVLDVDSMPHQELEQILRLKRGSNGCGSNGYGAVMLTRQAGAALHGCLTDREYLLYKPFEASELRGCVARSMQHG